MAYKNHIITDSSVVVVFDNDAKTINKDNPIFNRVEQALRNNDTGEVERIVDVASRIKEHTSGRFCVADDLVYIDGEELPETLSKRLITIVNSGLDPTPLEKFWNNLKENPNLESVKDLYRFLENNGNPITEDGCFLAYKRVTSDFKDLRTRTYDNSPGAVVTMPRSDVDHDRNRTCSIGLHVAAWNYAATNYGIYGDLQNGDKCVAVKVNPQDVCSVPVDYNDTKMRVCKYEVVKQVGNEFQDVIYQDHSNSYDVGPLSPPNTTGRTYQLHWAPTFSRYVVTYPNTAIVSNIVDARTPVNRSRLHLYWSNLKPVMEFETDPTFYRTSVSRFGFAKIGSDALNKTNLELGDNISFLDINGLYTLIEYATVRDDDVRAVSGTYGDPYIAVYPEDVPNGSSVSQFLVAVCPHTETISVVNE